MEYYYHGTDSLDTMIKIIESGSIKSKNKRKSKQYTLYNGDDYISVGKWDHSANINFDKMKYSCFYGWIFWRPTFIISEEVEAIHATRHIGSYNPDNDRVSCFIDEYHIRDEIPIDKIIGIAIPFSQVESKKELLEVQRLLQYSKLYKWNIYDSDSELINKVENNTFFDEMGFNYYKCNQHSTKNN